MCNVVLHFSARTGCICSLNEHGEFIIGTLISGDKPASGDLLVSDHDANGPASVFNVTRDSRLTIDIHFRTCSEVCARHWLKTRGVTF